MSKSHFGLQESAFDQDFNQQQMERLLKTFPTEEAVLTNLLEFRRSMGYVDMKRGELYPEVIGSVARLRRTIAEAYGISVVQSQPNFACNGCIDSMMTYISLAWNEQQHSSGSSGIGSRPALVVASPTYFRYYSATSSKRIRLVTVPYNSDYSYPTEAILASIKKEKAFGLILISPNNPTGITIPDDIMVSLIDTLPDDIIIMLDRTCANIEPEISTKELLKRFPNKNLAIFHSFSKYHGMSHIRIGFSVFSKIDFAKAVEPMLPFGLNLEGALKATRILSQGPLGPGQHILDNIRANQALLVEFQKKHPKYWVTPFSSNYALMHLPEELDSDTFTNALGTDGVFVMPGHLDPEPNPAVVRIHTGGLPETTQKMIESIVKHFGGK